MILNILLLSLAVVPVRARQHGLPPFSKRYRGVGTSRSRSIAAFGDPKYFTDRYVPADKPGVMLKVPNFDVLFEEICKVSPLAKQAITEDKPGGIKAIDNSADVYKWKTVDSNPKRLVSNIDKIDDFQSKGVPLLRFRSTLHGPTKKRAEYFSELVSTSDLRQRWDATNAIVDTIYSAASLDEVQKLQEYKYGQPSLFGIGYVKTKKSVVSPREQMTLCGLQNFPSGASIIWGVELEEDQNHLFPPGKRTPRSTSHIFAETLIPVGDDDTTFDVEYVLQLEVGGFPGWLTGPLVGETVKKMFSFADGYFKSGFKEGGELAQRLASVPDNEVADQHSLWIESSPEDSNNTNNTGILDQKQTLLMPP